MTSCTKNLKQIQRYLDELKVFWEAPEIKKEWIKIKSNTPLVKIRKYLLKRKSRHIIKEIIKLYDDIKENYECKKKIREKIDELSVYKAKLSETVYSILISDKKIILREIEKIDLSEKKEKKSLKKSVSNFFDSLKTKKAPNNIVNKKDSKNQSEKYTNNQNIENKIPSSNGSSQTFNQSSKSNSDIGRVSDIVSDRYRDRDRAKDIDTDRNRDRAKDKDKDINKGKETEKSKQTKGSISSDRNRYRYSRDRDRDRDRYDRDRDRYGKDRYGKDRYGREKDRSDIEKKRLDRLERIRKGKIEERDKDKEHLINQQKLKFCNDIKLKILNTNSISTKEKDDLENKKDNLEKEKKELVKLEKDEKGKKTKTQEFIKTLNENLKSISDIPEIPDELKDSIDQNKELSEINAKITALKTINIKELSKDEVSAKVKTYQKLTGDEESDKEKIKKFFPESNDKNFDKYKFNIYNIKDSKDSKKILYIIQKELFRVVESAKYGVDADQEEEDKSGEEETEKNYWIDLEYSPQDSEQDFVNHIYKLDGKKLVLDIDIQLTEDYEIVYDELYDELYKPKNTILVLEDKSSKQTKYNIIEKPNDDFTITDEFKKVLNYKNKPLLYIFSDEETGSDEIFKKYNCKPQNLDNNCAIIFNADSFDDKKSNSIIIEDLKKIEIPEDDTNPSSSKSNNNTQEIEEIDSKINEITSKLNKLNEKYNKLQENEQRIFDECFPETYVNDITAESKPISVESKKSKKSKVINISVEWNKSHKLWIFSDFSLKSKYLYDCLKKDEIHKYIQTELDVTNSENKSIKDDIVSPDSLIKLGNVNVNYIPRSAWLKCNEEKKNAGKDNLKHFNKYISKLIEDALGDNKNIINKHLIKATFLSIYNTTNLTVDKYNDPDTDKDYESNKYSLEYLEAKLKYVDFKLNNDAKSKKTWWYDQTAESIVKHILTELPIKNYEDCFIKNRINYSKYPEMYIPVTKGDLYTCSGLKNCRNEDSYEKIKHSIKKFYFPNSNLISLKKENLKHTKHLSSLIQNIHNSFIPSPLISEIYDNRNITEGNGNGNGTGNGTGNDNSTEISDEINTQKITDKYLKQYNDIIKFIEPKENLLEKQWWMTKSANEIINKLIYELLLFSRGPIKCKATSGTSKPANKQSNDSSKLFTDTEPLRNQLMNPVKNIIISEKKTTLGGLNKINNEHEYIEIKKNIENFFFKPKSVILNITKQHEIIQDKFNNNLENLNDNIKTHLKKLLKEIYTIDTFKREEDTTIHKIYQQILINLFKKYNALRDKDECIKVHIDALKTNLETLKYKINYDELGYDKYKYSFDSKDDKYDDIINSIIDFHYNPTGYNINIDFKKDELKSLKNSAGFTIIITTIYYLFSKNSNLKYYVGNGDKLGDNLFDGEVKTNYEKEFNKDKIIDKLFFSFPPTEFDDSDGVLEKIKEFSETNKEEINKIFRNYASLTKGRGELRKPLTKSLKILENLLCECLKSIIDNNPKWEFLKEKHRKINDTNANLKKNKTYLENIRTTNRNKENNSKNNPDTDNRTYMFEIIHDYIFNIKNVFYIENDEHLLITKMINEILFDKNKTFNEFNKMKCSQQPPSSPASAESLGLGLESADSLGLGLDSAEAGDDDYNHVINDDVMVKLKLYGTIFCYVKSDGIGNSENDGFGDSENDDNSFSDLK